MKTLALYRGDTVIERIEEGIRQGDSDATEAKEVFDSHKATWDGKTTDRKTGVDEVIKKYFKDKGDPDAAHKFVKARK